MKAPRILLVEDNPTDEALILRSLKKSRVLNDIDVVRDGAEALDYLFCTGSHAERDPDDTPGVVLLDLNLPKIDGATVLKRIKENDTTKRIPVVVLTSSDEESDLTAAYEFGVNSYVRKPVDFVSFTKAVSDLSVYWMILNKTPDSPR